MSNRIPLDYHWQHPLPNDFWPERYGGFQTPEDCAVALAVTECADAWRRNDPVTVANILRTNDTLRIAAQAAYFVSQPIRHDPNPPSILNSITTTALGVVHIPMYATSSCPPAPPNWWKLTPASGG